MSILVNENLITEFKMETRLG